MATRWLLVLVVACSETAPPAAPAPVVDPHGFLDHAAPAPAAPIAPPAHVLVAPPASATRSASGLASEVLVANASGEQPRRDDIVVVTLTAWDAQGRLVEHYTTGDAFTLADGMPGMIEGILAMRRGERRRLWISEALQGDYRLAAGTVVCDVELVDIVRAP